MSDVWEIFALKYADRNNRTRSESFIADPMHDAPHPMDYFVWLLKNGDEVILVDTGYDIAEADRRERPIIETPSTMLEGFGYPASGVKQVILTHLHYDHAGSLYAFPDAQLHVQAMEMQYATGPCMCHDHLRYPFTGEHICDAVRSLYAGKVSFIEGNREIAPGVECHLIGGHSRGLQAVRVRTRRGWVVLASDASHYYENFQARKPFPIVVDLEEMLTGFDKLHELADSKDHIVPGHDPLVRSLYPAVNGNENIVALHAEPKTL